MQGTADGIFVDIIGHYTVLVVWPMGPEGN